MKQLRHWTFPHSKTHSVHDVQVIEEDHFLYFNNQIDDDPRGLYSANALISLDQIHVIRENSLDQIHVIRENSQIRGSA